MQDKEKISSLITTGANLPPVNPYLDDSSAPDDDNTRGTNKKKRGRTPAIPPKVVQPSKNTASAPDPKEYIAELERPEEENLF